MTMSEFERQSLVNEIAEILSIDEFNKCVDSVHQTKEIGRLRFWQESHVEKIMTAIDDDQRDALDGMNEYETFLFFFEPEKCRFDQEAWEAYLADAGIPYREHPESEEDRFMMGWREIPKERQCFIDDAVRELSKIGSLCAFEHCFRMLACHISAEEALLLYADLQRSMRLTCEWKDEFLEIFTQVSSSELPPPIFDEEKACREAKEMLRQAEASIKNAKPENPDGADGDIPF